jgi:hypothetical protein
MNTLRRERLVDELVEASIDWRETCARANDAYRSWASATGPCSNVAFELYTAALDAEERAGDGSWLAVTSHRHDGLARTPADARLPTKGPRARDDHPSAELHPRRVRADPHPALVSAEQVLRIEVRDELQKQVAEGRAIPSRLIALF